MSLREGTYESYRRSVAVELLKIGAFQVENGRVSIDPYKLVKSALNNVSKPDDLIDFAGRCMQSLNSTKDLQFDSIIGIPTNGHLYANKLSRLSSRRCYELAWHEIVSPEYLHIYLNKPERVVLVDELGSNVSKILKVVAALRDSAHKTITGVLTVIDCDDRAREEFASADCSLISVYKEAELEEWKAASDSANFPFSVRS